MLENASYVGKCHSSYGELLQGKLPNNEEFLVTIPINIATKVTFFEQEPDHLESAVTVSPSTKKKTALFVQKLCQEFGFSLKGTIEVQSEIPEGKGLSSSTADMVAALRAIEQLLNISLPPERVGQILRSIEPSDGLLYAGSVIYNHKQCSLIGKLGFLPKTSIISIDDGGGINTIEYNRHVKIFSEEDKETYAHLLEEMKVAFAEKNREKVGAIATKSAILNQKFNFKKDLEQTIAIANTLGAYGVINTHSGTCLGILMNPANSGIEEAVQTVRKIFTAKQVCLYETI